MRTPPPTPKARADTALVEARRYRGEWLLGLGSEVVAVVDLIAVAATTEGRALRSVGLVRVLAAVPGTSEVAARAVVRRTVAAFPAAQRPARVTVGWLLGSPSTNRIEALAEAIAACSGAVPPGFPWRTPIGVSPGDRANGGAP